MPLPDRCTNPHTGNDGFRHWGCNIALIAQGPPGMPISGSRAKFAGRTRGIHVLSVVLVGLVCFALYVLNLYSGDDCRF